MHSVSGITAVFLFSAWLWCYGTQQSQSVTQLQNRIASDSFFPPVGPLPVKSPCEVLVIHLAHFICAEERRCHRAHQRLINAPFTLFMEMYSPRRFVEQRHSFGVRCFKCNEWNSHSNFSYRRLLMSVWLFDVMHARQAKWLVTTPLCCRLGGALKLWTSASLERHTCKQFMAQKEW